MHLRGGGVSDIAANENFPNRQSQNVISPRGFVPFGTARGIFARRLPVIIRPVPAAGAYRAAESRAVTTAIVDAFPVVR